MFGKALNMPCVTFKFIANILNIFMTIHESINYLMERYSTLNESSGTVVLISFFIRTENARKIQNEMLFFSFYCLPDPSSFPFFKNIFLIPEIKPL